MVVYRQYIHTIRCGEMCSSAEEKRNFLFFGNVYGLFTIEVTIFGNISHFTGDTFKCIAMLYCVMAWCLGAIKIKLSSATIQFLGLSKCLNTSK